MGLKVFTTDFQNISNQEFFRLDFGYRHFFDKQNAVIYNFDKYTLLKYILKEIQSNKIPKGELKDEEILVALGNIKRRYNYLINLEKVNEIGSDKNILQNGDIVIPKMQPQMGNIFLNLKHERYIASTELLEYTINTEYNPVFIYYLIVSKKFLTSLKKLESGKTHRRVKSEDLLKIKIPLISKAEQDRIVAAIEPIENRIKKLKSHIRAPHEIINEVFAKEFGFDLEYFDKSKKETFYYLDFFSFGNNKDLRQSVKFHRKAGLFVVEQIRKITNKKIKDFISEPIVLGKGISPEEYDEDGNYFYISMANIKNWQFESENSKLVSRAFSNKNMNKTVAKNDILLARSGEGTIGKVALIDDEYLQGIFADFTMRIRLKNYNQHFAYYYFRTAYFQYLIEINKKGLGNNTNIFPSQVQEFPLIDIPLDRQEKIVDEIKAELDKQEAMKSRIESARNEIDKIIAKAVG